MGLRRAWQVTSERAGFSDSHEREAESKLLGFQLYIQDVYDGRQALCKMSYIGGVGGN